MKTDPPSNPKKLPECGYQGCKKPVTHWYQLMTRVVTRCDEHGYPTFASTIFDWGEIHILKDKKKAKRLGLTKIDLTIPGIIGPVDMKFCKKCGKAQEHHTFAEEQECNSKS